jgi:transglutaminase-like putative cysteine protease
MRLQIRHETTYNYDTPALSVTQVLRLTPRGHDGQFVVDWRVEVDHDCHLRQATDAFGNIVHSFALSGPVSSLTVTALGEIETEDTHGVVRGEVERFPSTIFLRETALTRSSGDLRQFAEDITAGETDKLSLLHALNNAIHNRMRFDTGRTDASTPAMEAFAAGHGVCQDYAHIFIAAARHLGLPARYAGGYLFHADMAEQKAGHGWVEALVEDLGWVAFDPANGISATDAYARVAVGLDYLGAAPIRGARHGGSEETLDVRIRVDDIGLR